MEREDLKKLLDYHDNLYYNKDSPELTDAEYDSLKRQYGEYEYVPGEASSDLTRVKHTSPISSLEKVNDLDNLEKAMRRLAPFIIQPKLDGLTVVAYPDIMATRGNGEYGEDISNTASQIIGFDNAIAIKQPVRMEAFIKKSTFLSINKMREIHGGDPFKNPRNAVAGMLRNKDATKVTGVSYMAYNIVGSTDKETEQLHILQKHNFSVVSSFKNPRNNSAVFEEGDIPAAIKLIRGFDRDGLDYEIDGLVIKSNRENSLELFGATGHHPKNAVAYKFEPEGEWTKLIDVVWQVGRTGKVTPVAIIEPVEILGSAISRVTLHNESIINALNINIGCDVYVIKANDVIPAIIECVPHGVDELWIPSECPCCGSKLNKVKDQLFCIAPDCETKTAGGIVHLAKRDALDIEGLSEETASKMVDKGLGHPFDIFNLSLNDILELPGFAKRSAEKLYDNIQKARKADLNRFLYAAAVPGIGRSASRDIANHFGSLKNFLENIEDTSNIPGIGDIMMQSIRDYNYLWYELAQHVTPRDMSIEKKTSPDKVLTIVITGTFMDGDRKVSRKEIEDIIRSSGHKTSGSVSKNTDIIMVGENAAGKANDAQILIDSGVPIKMIRSIFELREYL